MLRTLRLTVATLVLATAIASLGSCTVGVAYLIYDELKKDEPLVIWQGVVTDTSKAAVDEAIVMVHFKLETEAESDERTYQGTTDEDGKFTIELRWNKYARYSVVIIHLNQYALPDGYQGIYIANENKTALNLEFDVQEPTGEQN